MSAKLRLLLLFIVSNCIAQNDGANLAQLKNPQQQQAQLQQQHSKPTSAQPAQVQQQQAQQLSSHLQSPHMQNAQYMHEKDSLPDAIKNINAEEEFNDPYQVLSEMKQDINSPSLPMPWNSFNLPQNQPPHQPATAGQMPTFDAYSSLHTPKFLPFVGYPQPIFIPYPLYIAPEMFYPTFSGQSNNIEATMGRANDGIQATTTSNIPYQRNSPIYYVRIPPYMFLPGGMGGYSAPIQAPPAPSLATAAFFSSLPAFNAYSSIFNLPFLSNGKPSNIYQISGSPADIQSSLQYAGLNGFNTSPYPTQPPNPYRPDPYRPIASPSNIYLQQQQLPSYSIAAAPTQSNFQDSKMTLLKRPFIFNGRPEDIYIVPSSFNSPLYGDTGYY